MPWVGVGIYMYALGLDDKNLYINHSTLACSFHDWYRTFQVAEIALPRALFADNLWLADGGLGVSWLEMLQQLGTDLL